MPEENESEGIRSLREEKKRLEAELANHKAQAERAGQLERQLAFMQAGVDPSAPQHKYFVQGYDGELTAAAIQAEAKQLGLGGTPAVPAPPANTPPMPTPVSGAPTMAESLEAQLARVQLANQASTGADGTPQTGFPGVTPGSDQELSYKLQQLGNDPTFTAASKEAQWDATTKLLNEYGKLTKPQIGI